MSVRVTIKYKGLDKMKCRCKGKAFYLKYDKELNEKTLRFCNHEPEEKYQRVYTTAVRACMYSGKMGVK